MNFDEIKHSVNHIKKTCKCVSCKRKFKDLDIHVVATTHNEGLIELRCDLCNCSTIVTVSLNSDIEIKENCAHRSHQGISKNDILDMKNFLSGFDGNFKKIFKQK